MLGSCFSLEKQKEKLNEIYEFFKLNNRYPSVKNHEEEAWPTGYMQPFKQSQEKEHANFIQSLNQLQRLWDA